MRWIFSSELRPIALALGLFGVLLSGADWAASGNLEPSKGSISTSDRAAIRTVIEQQLDAFQ